MNIIIDLIELSCIYYYAISTCVYILSVVVCLKDICESIRSLNAVINRYFYITYEEKQRDVLARAKCLLILQPICYLAYLIGRVDTRKGRVRSSMFI